jgi:hypothetical protein
MIIPNHLEIATKFSGIERFGHAHGIRNLARPKLVEQKGMVKLAATEKVDVTRAEQS